VKNFIIGVISITVIIAIAVTAYQLGTKNKANVPPVSPSPSPTIDTSALTGLQQATPKPPTPAPVSVEDQIIAAISSKNYAALKGYMADPVQVRLESSGCCGPITPTAAVTQLDYLNPATSWNFDQSQETVTSLHTFAPEFYGPEWLIGVADNEMVASFKVTANQITDINLMATYKLLLP